MANYHCHFQIFKRGEGRSAVAGASYRSGEKITNEYDGITHDYNYRKSVTASASYRSGDRIINEKDGAVHDFTKRGDVVHSEILLPENAPREFLNGATMWNAIEKKDRRCNAQLAREANISLPIEFNTEQNIELAREFVNTNFVSKGVCAQLDIHDDGQGNPHFHVMLTMRDVDESGFGKRRAEEQGQGYFQKEKRLLEWRKSWADIANKHLEIHGFDERIDHRTLKAQGIDREPMKYMGRDYKKKKAQITANKAEIKEIEREIKMLEIKREELSEFQRSHALRLELRQKQGMERPNRERPQRGRNTEDRKITRRL